MGESTWKICSTCRRAIEFEQRYWVCSVSTCNRKRVGLYFCSVPCWDAHVPDARHRDAWAEERKAPSASEWRRQREAEERDGSPHGTTRIEVVSWQRQPEAEERDGASEPTAGDETARRRRIVSSAVAADLPADVMIVVSKLKAYIRARAGMNTSDAVTGVLSDHVRRLCDEAIRNAAREGRKTVLVRDFEPLV